VHFRAHHHVFPDFGVFGHHAVRTYAAVISELNVLTGAKVGASVYGCEFTTFFEYSLAASNSDSVAKTADNRAVGTR
jgi:hypothetical protein